MSLLLRFLQEANVPLSSFCKKLNISEEHALMIAHTADENSQIDIYMDFLAVLNDETLFNELLDFYEPFVSDKEDLTYILSNSLSNRKNNIPRKMLNSVCRLVSLADKMEEVLPGKDSLKVFYFVVCIETLYHLRDGKVGNKTSVVIEFFNNYLSTSDKQFILDRFQRSLGDERFSVHRLNYESEQEYRKRINNLARMTTQITIEAFARIINEIRNSFVHEGDYWSFNFAQNDISLQNSIIVGETYAEAKLKRDGQLLGLNRVYDVDLTYKQFKAVCIRGFLKFIRTYLIDIKP